MAKPHAKLRGLMMANDYTMPQLARKLGLGKSAMSERLNYHRNGFTLDEAYTIMRLFKVPNEQLHEIFPPKA
ncbi:MAG TPA: helix-turn-helix transcriptional regulator [Candidatus Limiplasma sp.]|mgnify:FL=1|nr:helix-turn-helix transcriptional regulator [Candidatus Limiplasma sp.]HRX09916.1 helix-turn-helix transcriptional regulator [Candidatus Limiplasma sp.]